jgi:hypothetical protein
VESKKCFRNLPIAFRRIWYLILAEVGKTHIDKKGLKMVEIVIRRHTGEGSSETGWSQWEVTRKDSKAITLPADDKLEEFLKEVSYDHKGNLSLKIIRREETKVIIAITSPHKAWVRSRLGFRLVDELNTPVLEPKK